MMAQRSRMYKPGLILLAVLLLVPVFLSQRGLNRTREAMGLSRGTQLENAPPLLALTTVALGSFRGLIANALWIRATELQENDKYFEMVQLADWITKLQPHFSTVWIHQAWNMSYNISVKFPEAEDRWPWVRRGIELLRDEGLRYNPKDPLIYRELAWHFQHKMGQNLDDAHNYYKYIWAREFSAVLTNGRPNFEELVHPKTPEAQERADLLRDKFKMDPEWMKRVDDEYGPLEWRLPESHAIYWASLGLEKTKDETHRRSDFVQLRRVIFQSMQLAFHRGRIVFPDKRSDEFIYGPNIEVVGRANRAYEEMIAQEGAEQHIQANLQNAHKNFLKTAVYFLYTHNRISAAEQWFQYLYQNYPDSLLTYEQQMARFENPNLVFPRKTVDEYALERVQEDVGETSHDRIKSVVEGMLTTSMVNFAMGEDDQGLGYDRFAQRVYTRFQESIGTQQQRVGLPPFADLKREVVNRLLDPETGLEAPLDDQLRTVLGLPAGTTEVAAQAPGPARPEGGSPR